MSETVIVPADQHMQCEISLWRCSGQGLFPAGPGLSKNKSTRPIAVTTTTREDPGQDNPVNPEKFSRHATRWNVVVQELSAGRGDVTKTRITGKNTG